MAEVEEEEEEVEAEVCDAPSSDAASVAAVRVTMVTTGWFFKKSRKGRADRAMVLNIEK